MPSGSHNAKLFINYRREDTAPYAGRLYDRLTAHFGEDQVFIDIDQIEPGEDFVEVINGKVGACDIAIVSIGPNWLTATDSSGKRRLDDSEDFVRVEIIAALQRKIRVIPVLVGGARMPRKQDLPEELAPLSRRNAIELSETRFHSDVNRLIEAIEKPRSFPEKKTEPLPGPVAPIAESVPPVKLADPESLPKTSAFRPLAESPAVSVAPIAEPAPAAKLPDPQNPQKPSALRLPVELGAELLKALLGKWKNVLAAALVTLLVAGVMGGWWFGIQQPQREREVMEAVVVAAQANSNGHYANAWHRLEQAQKTADEGGELAKLVGRLDEPRRLLRQEQEKVAMAWLRDTDLAEGETFSSVVDPLLPVLEEAAATATSVRAGDLQAHIGWAYFLKNKDNSLPADPVPHYREALASDPGNPYAHVFWGHWILWHNGPLAEARQHFDAAVVAERDLSFVRRIELAALNNNHSPLCEAELIRVANEMNKNHEKIDDLAVGHIWSVYYTAFGDDAKSELLDATVPAAEQLALIESLFEGTDFDPSKVPLREACLAHLEETAGRRDAALRRWRALRTSLPRDASTSIVARADAAIKRLSQPTGTSP